MSKCDFQMYGGLRIPMCGGNAVQYLYDSDLKQVSARCMSHQVSVIRNAVLFKTKLRLLTGVEYEIGRILDI